MTARAMSIWQRVIAANIITAVFNCLFSITIPLGLWRWSYDSVEIWQLIAAFLAVSVSVWLAAFFYCSE